MPYLGNVPAENYAQVSYQDLTGGSGTSFTLDYPVGSAGEIEVFVNNVRQEPTVAYTVSGTSLTMTGSIAATDDFYVVFQGKAQQTIGIPEKQTDGTYLFGDSVTIDADGSTVLTVDRATSNGTIIDVQKDGTTVGSIGVSSSDNLEISATTGGGAGIMLWGVGGTSPVISPMKEGSTVDAEVSLGRSSERYKDLYLSGGVYLGGTGSANLLDNVETGSWSPSTSNGSFQNVLDAHYIKIGNQVTVWLYAQSISDITTATNFQINNLPFTSSTDVDSVTGTVMLRYLNRSTSEQTNLISYMDQNGTTLRIYAVINNANYAVVRNSDFTNGNIGLRITLTYITT